MNTAFYPSIMDQALELLNYLHYSSSSSCPCNINRIVESNETYYIYIGPVWFFWDKHCIGRLIRSLGCYGAITMPTRHMCLRENFAIVEVSPEVRDKLILYDNKLFLGSDGAFYPTNAVQYEIFKILTIQYGNIMSAYGPVRFREVNASDVARLGVEFVKRAAHKRDGPVRIEDQKEKRTVRKRRVRFTS